jgi:hypothetical protein
MAIGGALRKGDLADVRTELGIQSYLPGAALRRKS